MAKQKSRLRAGRFDFHLHTDRSDGQLSPERLWQTVRERRMTGVSITDHDSVDAYDRLTEAPLVHRVEREPQGGVPWLLPGVELSTSRNGEELHVLGYFPRGISMALRDFVEKLLAGRDERISTGVRWLRERGVDISLRECREMARGRVVSRSHVAEVLLRKRYVQREKQAYDLFLRPGAFPPSACATTAAISGIKALGGLAVWAHPKDEQLTRHLRSLADAGVDGVEVYTPWRRRRERSRILRAVNELGLVVTAGSDWHGQPERERCAGFWADEGVVGEFLRRVEDRLDACSEASGDSIAGGVRS